MADLTICIPSNKSYELCRNSISLAIEFSCFMGCNIVISDNSGCKKKADWLATIDLPTVKIKRGKPDIVDNWLNSVSGVDTTYIGIVADDDVLIGVNSDWDKECFSKNYAGIIPNIILHNPQRGAYNINKIEAMSDCPKERSQQLMQSQQPSNSSLFGWFRRKQFLALMQRASRLPLSRVGVHDWAITSLMASYGKVKSFSNSIYTYSNTNWSGTQEFVEQNLVKLYTTNGFSGDLLKYRNIHGILDYVWLVHEPMMGFENNIRQDLIVQWINGHLGDALNKGVLTKFDLESLDNLKKLVELFLHKLSEIEEQVAKDYKLLMSEIGL